MPSLLDIAPPEIATETVNIRGTDLVLRGLSALDIARLMNRFPAMRAHAVGREMPDDDGGDLMVEIENSSAIIAAGLGEAGNQEIEDQVAIRLSSDEMAAVLNTITRLTNPTGAKAGPLADPPANGAAAPITEVQATN